MGRLEILPLANREIFMSDFVHKYSFSAFSKQLREFVAHFSTKVVQFHMYLGQNNYFVAILEWIMAISPKIVFRGF